MAEFVHHDTPVPNVRVEPVGTEPKITYHVDWPAMEHPTPKMFDDVGSLEVRLAVLSSHFQIDEVEEAADEALQAIQHLKDVMLDERELDGDQRADVALGDLEVLPEVSSKDVEKVPLGGVDG